MKALYQINTAQTATFGGGAGLAVVSPFRVESTTRPAGWRLGGMEFEEITPRVRRMLRYYAGMSGDAGVARLLAGEPVQTGSGVVQILEV